MGSSPSKRKGTRFEVEVAEYLGVERATLRGSKDRGDLLIAGWAVECKNERLIRLADYMSEAEVERKNARAMFGCAVVKRRGKGPAKAYVVMELDQFRHLAGGDWQNSIRPPLESHQTPQEAR